jgi:ubiquinone/menaquinone biosynthesis C-methylase UbiE
MDSVSRFNNRVENYIKYRPGYPPVIIDFLKKEIGLKHSDLVSDIGSGTGILSELFLKNGNKVFGIEPNEEMRFAAEKLLKKYYNFHSIDGKAEDTKLSDNSTDLITAGQSFHWFNNDNTRKEFKRILKPDGSVILIWNNRSENSSKFMKDYDQLLNNLESDYMEVKHENLNDNDFQKFFGTKSYLVKSFDNYQSEDYKSLAGGLLSASYTPTIGEAYTKMINEVKEIFAKHKENGKIKIEYKTKVYYGKII